MSYAICHFFLSISKFVVAVVVVACPWDAKPHIGFKAKGYVIPEKQAHFTMAGIRFLSLDDRW